jgi:membrane-bound lytic murein transglycosylase MltF
MLPNDSAKAVDAGEVDFTLMDSDAALWATRHQLKNAVAAFPVGPLEGVGWAFRKDDKDLQAAVQAFFAAERVDLDSALQALWTKTYGLSLTKFITLITAIK